MEKHISLKKEFLDKEQFSVAIASHNLAWLKMCSSHCAVVGCWDGSTINPLSCSVYCSSSILKEDSEKIMLSVCFDLECIATIINHFKITFKWDFSKVYAGNARSPITRTWKICKWSSYSVFEVLKIKSTLQRSNLWKQYVHMYNSW